MSGETRTHSFGHPPPDQGMLQNAVVALLRRIPDRWAEFDRDALAVTESNALYLLVAAGMVERRIRFRTRMHNHPVAVEATITATGEYGTVEGLTRLSAAMWRDWRDGFHAWQRSETRAEAVFLCEHLQPDEWRLTDQGVIAREDVDSDKVDVAIDFVLCRGFFDGRPRLVEGRASQRKPVRGSGELVTMRKVPADAIGPINVNVGNWTEGANAFAEAMGHKSMESIQSDQTLKAATETSSDVSLPNRARTAGEQYRQAAEALGVTNPTDRAAYDQVSAAMELSGERWELPTFDTWQRNLREYRRLTGQQKSRPRAGRQRGGGSLVRPDDIEPEHLPTPIRPKHMDQ